MLKFLILKYHLKWAIFHALVSQLKNSLHMHMNNPLMFICIICIFIKKNNDDSHTKIASIILSFSNKVFNISCDSKEILIKICTALENSMKQDVSNVLLQNKDIKYIHDESIHVEIGDNNTIQSANVGKNNSIKTESLTPKESFWSHVFQTLVANWLWFIFGLGLIVLTGYFGLKNLDWMNVF